jgi:putative ABC transport system permease protein
VRAFALRSLASHKRRALLTTVAVVLGVMMVSATYVLTDTIEQSFDDIFVESNAGIDAVVTSDDVVEQDDGQEPPLSQGLVAKVRRVAGVGAAAGSRGPPTRW